MRGEETREKGGVEMRRNERRQEEARKEETRKGGEKKRGTGSVFDVFIT